VNGDYMYVVDCRGDTLRGTREFDVDIATLAVSSLTGRVYLGLYDTAQVMVMDTFDSLVGSIAIPGRATDEIDALTFWPGRNELYGATDGALAFVVDASVDTLAGTVSYATVTATKMVHNPAGNKLYVLCPDQDEVLVFDSTFASPKHVAGGVYNASAVPVLDPALNRVYVAHI
jgi:DNA-binding beta-propeller fold protein YncE